MKRKILALVIIALSFAACNTAQSKLDKVGSEIEFAEQNKKEMTSEDWSNLEMMIEELEIDVQANKKKYSEEQIKEFGRLQGRYTALIINKGLIDFQELVKDLGNQMDGFIEGINSDQ